MDDEVAIGIAEAIMRDQNADNLHGFGDMTMGRLRAMLATAAKTGYSNGYSEGVRDGQGE